MTEMTSYKGIKVLNYAADDWGDDDDPGTPRSNDDEGDSIKSYSDETPSPRKVNSKPFDSNFLLGILVGILIHKYFI
tara:strand:- start:542 stop:772 length:231 start_codon:yes stop_codon:yes gene_type:complete